MSAIGITDRFDVIIVDRGSYPPRSGRRRPKPPPCLSKLYVHQIKPFLDWLDYNGYTVVTKTTKESIDVSGRRKAKGNMDIELAVDAMELAGHVGQIVLFSGEGSFARLSKRCSAVAFGLPWFPASQAIRR